MEILGKFPGLPGLFVACAFSGTLRSVKHELYKFKFRFFYLSNNTAVLTAQQS